eukprot:1090563-Rhodomonas_salina.4
MSGTDIVHVVGIFLRACYAMSSTETAHTATLCYAMSAPNLLTVSLAPSIGAIPGTDAYAMSGSDLAYAAIRLRDVRY